MSPHTIRKPTDLLALQPAARPYKVGAGRSLFVLVMPHGAMYWRMKYRFQGREKQYSIGTYPGISLNQAKEARDQARLLLEDGIDPVQARRDAIKDRPKPKTDKNPFRLELSYRGEMTIETETRIIRLTAGQVTALRSFLRAAPAPQHKDRK